MCCINKGRVCWSVSPTLTFSEKEACLVWGMKHDSGTPPLPSWVMVYVCVCMCFSFVYPPVFYSFLPFLIPFHKGFPAESSWCPILAAFPRLSGLSQEINGCLFSPVLWFYVWTDMASTILICSAELFPFRCASLQIAEISRGPVSNCLSHLVFNLLKSGL